jgi:phosphatidate cytidylyltransferase
MPGLWLLPLTMIIAVLAGGEVLWLLSSRNIRPVAWVVHAGNVLIVAANWFGYWQQGPGTLASLGWPAMALALGVIGLFMAEMHRYSGPGGVTERLAGGILSLTYVGLMLTFVIHLRFLGGGAWGLPALLSLIVAVKMCDTGAYTVGRLIGRHKLAPVLSPGKTMEGLLGGLTFALLGSWATFNWLLPSMAPAREAGPAWGWVIFGLAVGSAGVVGDLAESLLKRDLGRKDSSPWMPGFGGVLDIMDSILLASPVAFICWIAGWV